MSYYQRDMPLNVRPLKGANTIIVYITGKNNGLPFLDILGYLNNTNKNPKFDKVRQIPTRQFPTKFPDWDLSHSSKFGIFVGIL